MIKSARSNGLKPTTLIPPVAALVIAGSWLGAQHHSISVLESESALLRKHIADARSGSVGPDSAKPDKPSGARAKDKEPLDWKKIAAEVLESQRGNGMENMRTMIHLQQRLLSMSKEELVAALEEIATLDLPAGPRAALEQMLMGPLIEKDPQLALNLYSTKFQNLDGMNWQFANALGKWAEKDLGKATAWLDQQIAAGKFESKSLDGNNAARVQFEGALIGFLVGSDATAAAARLADFTGDDKLRILRSSGPNLVKEKDQKAFADLIRSQLPEKERNRTVAMFATNVSAMAYPEASAYLDRIAATPDERTAAATQMAQMRMAQVARQGAITREDIDTMRGWVSAQSPGTVDATTGKALAAALGNFNGKLKFEDAAAFALQYQASSGNDEVLASFLASGQAQQHKEEAIKLADKISDEKRREEILSRLK